MNQRSPIVATLLSIFIPFYVIYWFYTTGKDMKAKGADVPSAAFLLAPLVLILLFIVIAIAGTASGANEGFASIVYLLFLPVILAVSIYYAYKFSAAVEQATDKAISKGLLFILFWLVQPAGVFMAQEKLNNIAAPAGPSPVPPSQPV